MLHDTFRGPVPLPRPDDLSALRDLTQRMADLGFEEKSIERALHVGSLPYRRINHIPAYRRRLRDEAQLGQAISFWLLQLPVALEALRQMLGDKALAVLQRLHWLEICEEGVRSRVDLYPCCGRYFFTDTAYSRNPWPEQVYWLGGDSYTLARCTPRRNMNSALDICTGSGIHAILARAHCSHSVGVDINERALQFSRINAHLNGLAEGTQFLISDCYQAIQESFDLITLNPPFVPSPKHIKELYRTGGESGESVTERVMRGLPQHLRENGIFSMSTEAPILRHASPLDRCREWLGEGWGLAALYKQECPVEDYILGHVLATNVAPHLRESEFESWWDVYQELGITSMVSAQFYAVRLPAGTRGWSKERVFPHPDRDQSEWLSNWLDVLQAWHGEWQREFRPALHTQVEQLYFSEAGVVAELANNGWNAVNFVRYGPVHARLLKDIQAGKDLHEISPEDETALQELGCDLLITCF